MCRNVFFPWILGTLIIGVKLKPICVRAEGTGILQMALLRRTAWWRQELTREIAGRCCPIGPSEGATLDMAGAALDSFEAASPWDMVLCLLLPAGHNINLSLALLPKVADCKLECQTRHPLYEENLGHFDGRSSCVMEHEGNIYQSFFIIHSQVLYMVQKPCVRGMYRGEPGDRNKISGDCAKWGVLNFLFAKWIPQSLLSKGSIKHSSALITLGISWIYPARMPLESDLV